MNKKEYMTPDVQVIEIEKMTLLAGSGVSSDNGIGYGGLDEGSLLEPESPELFDVSEGMSGLDIEL